MKKIIFIGSNLNIKLFAEAAERQGLSVAGILDDDYHGQQSHFQGIEVLGKDSDLEHPTLAAAWKDRYVFFIATNWSSSSGHNRDIVKRLRQIELCLVSGIECINLIDPSSFVSESAMLGKGIYIGPFCYIEPNCHIKDFAQVWYGCGISHGSVIGENSILQRQCGISAQIGKNSYISMWCKIYGENMSTIGNNVIINPGLYVSRNVPDGEVVRITKNSKRIWQYPVKV